MFSDKTKDCRKSQSLGFPMNFLSDWNSIIGCAYSFDTDSFSEDETEHLRNILLKNDSFEFMYLERYYLNLLPISKITALCDKISTYPVRSGLNDLFKKVLDEILDNRELFPSLYPDMGILYQYDFFEGVPPKKTIWEILGSGTESYTAIRRCDPYSGPHEEIERLGQCKSYLIYLEEDDIEKAISIYRDYLVYSKKVVLSQIDKYNRAMNTIDTRLTYFSNKNIDITELPSEGIYSKNRSKYIEKEKIFSSFISFSSQNENWKKSIRYIQRKGKSVIEQEIRKYIKEVLSSPSYNDSMRRKISKKNRLYYVLFATHCNTRFSISHTYGICENISLTSEDQERILSFTMEWIQRQFEKIGLTLT